MQLLNVVRFATRLGLRGLPQTLHDGVIGSSRVFGHELVEALDRFSPQSMPHLQLGLVKVRLYANVGDRQHLIQALERLLPERCPLVFVQRLSHVSLSGQ
jgi:hypothetical protein